MSDVIVSVWWRDAVFLEGGTGFDGATTIRETQIIKSNQQQAHEYAQSVLLRGALFEVGNKSIHVPVCSIIRVEYNNEEAVDVT